MECDNYFDIIEEQAMLLWPDDIFEGSGIHKFSFKIRQ